jgi:Domain of unknown function (DUF4376)
MYFAEIKDGLVDGIYQADDALRPDWVPSSEHVRPGMAWTDTLLSELSAAAAKAAKDDKLAAIKTERDRRIQTGGYLVGAKWFHSDTFSRTQQMGLVMLGTNIPSGTHWKTMDGTFVVMTPSLAGQIFAAAAAKDIATFAAAEAHIAAVTASLEPSSYDFSGGWPAVYQDTNLT